MNTKSIVRKYVLLLFISTFFICSCSKELQAVINGTGTSTLLEQYFETNILNRDFIINLAINNSVDVTSNYNGYLFKLLKGDLYHGEVKATKGAAVYSGTWSCNNDYSKLTIAFPSIPSEFVFLNREWRFTKKAVPQMELAPWGSAEPHVLHMLRQ